MNTIKKTILTLVALLAVTTGAWADETPLVTINSTGYTTFTSGSKTFDDKVTVTFSNSVSNDGDHWGWYTDGSASLLTVAGINGYTITSCKFYTFDGTAKTGYTVAGESPSVYLSNDKVYTDANQSVDLGKFGISKIEVFGGVAPATYTVSMKEGTEDAANWQGKAGTGEYQALPLEGVAANTAVSVKYSGTKKVKSVKAKKKAAAGPKALSASAVGEVVGTDGMAYDVADKDNLPTGVTAAGMVAYKSGSNGLVIALADEASTMNWSTANGASGAAAHTPTVTGQTWKLPSLAEWQQMFSANGGNQNSYTGLNTALAAAGGDSSKLQGNAYYWSSSEGSPSFKAYFLNLSNGDAGWLSGDKGTVSRVRACLAF